MADEGAGLPVATPGGRPLAYTPELGAEVCRRVARGGTLIEIEADQGMPAAETVLAWIQDHEDFGDAYERARGMMADVLVDEAREVTRAATPGDVWVARLRFDAARWMAGMLSPRKYLPRVVADEAIAQARAEVDPRAGGMTVIVKRFSDVTPEEEAAADLTEQGYFDRAARSLRR